MIKDIGEVLDAIAWAHRIVTVNDEQYVFRPLSLQDRNIANHIHLEALKKGREDGLKLRDVLRNEAIRKGIWKIHHDNDLKILKEELEKKRPEREKLEQQSKSKRNAPTALVLLKKRMDFVEKTISDLDQVYISCIELPSLEYYAEQARAHYAIGQATLRFPSMTRKWSDHNALLAENDTDLIHRLVNEYYRLEIADESTIRAAARSPVWRIKWSGSKKNGGVKTLFGRDMYDLTMDQFRLVYWSQIYDSAFESITPPDEETVEDDKLFDTWMEKQNEKRKQERAQKAINDKMGKNKEGQEVGVMVDGFYSEACNCGVKDMKHRNLHKHANSCPYGVFMYHNDTKKEKEVDGIQAVNPEHIRRILAKEQKILADKKDTVEEQDLRRDDSTRAAFGMPTQLIGRDGPKGRVR